MSEKQQPQQSTNEPQGGAILPEPTKRQRRKTSEAQPAQERQPLHESLTRLLNLARDAKAAAVERARLFEEYHAAAQRHAGLVVSLDEQRSAYQAMLEEALGIDVADVERAVEVALGGAPDSDDDDTREVVEP